MPVLYQNAFFKFRHNTDAPKLFWHFIRLWLSVSDQLLTLNKRYIIYYYIIHSQGLENNKEIDKEPETCTVRRTPKSPLPYGRGDEF